MKSSPQIKKINAELQKLFATANRLKSLKVDLRINDQGLIKAAADARRLGTDLRGLSRAVALRVNTSGLTQAAQQIAALRAAAARPVTLATRAGATPRAPFGGGLLSGMGGAFTAHQLVTAVARATRDGVNDSDIGETSLLMKQLSPTDLGAAREAIRQLGDEKAKLPGGAFLNIGQRTQSFSEMMGVTKDVEGAKFLTGWTEELTRLLYAQGKSFQEANEGAIDYGKALQQMGRLTVHTAARAAELSAQTGKAVKIGDFDPGTAGKSFEWLVQMAPGIGREFSGQFVRNISKYLSSTKLAISDEAFGAVLLMGEEMGTRAAVGYAQAVKQLSGKGLTKEALRQQAKFGLITLGEEKIGSVGKKQQTRITANVPADYKKMLQTDLPKAVATYIGPKAKAAGVDITDPQAVYDFASKIASDRTAIEAIGAALYRYEDIAKDIEAAKARSGKIADVRRITAGSVRGVTQGLQNQFESVLGESVMAIAPAITPVMGGISEFMRKQAAEIKQAGDKGDWGALAGKAWGAANAAFLAMPAYQALKATAGAVAQPLGLTAGLTAMMDPRTRALGGAGISLLNAASELSGAAAALMLSAKTQGGADFLSQLVKNPALRGLALQLGVSGIIQPGDVKELSDEDKRTAQKAIVEQTAIAKAAELEARRQNRALLAKEATKKGAPAWLKEEGAKQDREIFNLGAALQDLRIEVERLSQPGASMFKPLGLPEGRGNWIVDTLKQLREIKPPPVSQQREWETGKDVSPPPPKWPDDPIPAPNWLPQFKEQPTWIPQLLSATQTAPSITAAATQLATVTSTLPAELFSASTMFAQTFSTASTQLGAAGQSAADIILAGARGAGSVYGNTAAGIIAAAAASATINVNTNVRETGKADTGSHKPT